MESYQGSVFGPLVGETLAGVTFIWSYYQLQIGARIVSVYTPPVVTFGKSTWTLIADGYRDALCGRIGKVVSSIDESDENLSLGLSDGSVIKISFLPEDRIEGATESLVMQAGPGQPIVVIGDE